jgi:hypothetical protein
MSQPWFSPAGRETEPPFDFAQGRLRTQGSLSKV